MKYDEEAMAQAERVLAAIPEDRLHMRRYAEADECGTAFCFGGWLALDPWFQENRGLVLLRRGNLSRVIKTQEEAAEVMMFGNRSGITVSDHTEAPSHGVLADALGLETNDAFHLFAIGDVGDWGPHAVSKEMVAENLRRIKAGYPAVAYYDMPGSAAARPLW